MPTLTSCDAGEFSDSKPLVVTAHGIRRLTAIETERAMGFPDHWTAGKTTKIRRDLLGNAVVPNVAEWLGRRLQEVERSSL